MLFKKLSALLEWALWGWSRFCAIWRRSTLRRKNYWTINKFYKVCVTHSYFVRPIKFLVIIIFFNQVNVYNFKIELVQFTFLKAELYLFKQYE